MSLATRPAPSETRSERSRLAVVRLLRERGIMSRADIARATGLSRSTVSGIVTALVADDLVVELGTAVPPAGGGAGRPGAAVMMNPAGGEAIGVDFGYRHVHVIIANVAHAVRIARSERLPVAYDPARGLDAAADLVRAAIREAGTDTSRILGVGVSVPGPFDTRRGVPHSGMPSPWSGIPVAAELSARLGLPVVADGDAKLGALAERRWGAARECDEFVYVKLHGGVGGAFVSNGLLTRGSTGGAGEMQEIIGELLKRDMKGHIEFTRMTGAVVQHMRLLEKPIIAALNGMTAGAGSVLALASDLRIASERARFAFLFTKVGLTGADMGAGYLLPRIVGMGRAFELLLLGDTIDAQTAERYGLVNRVVPHEELLGAARAWAGRLAKGPSLAIGMTKRMITNEMGMDLVAAVEAEAQAQALLLMGEDHRIFYEAFTAKQKPQWTGR